MAEFTIPDADLQAIFSTRIIDSLSQETKDKMIADALTWLVTPPPHNYGYSRKTTPMQVAFESALERMADQVASEVLEEKGVRDTLRDKYRAQFAEMPQLATDRVLQGKFFKVILDRAEEIRRENS